MKKITSKEDITFRVDGTTVLKISPKGCLADDSAAAHALSVLGGNITVVDIDEKDAVKEAVADVEPEVEATTEAASATEVEAAPVEEGAEDAKPKRARGKTK